MISDAERAELAARTEAHCRDGNIWLLLTEAHALDMASGYVPNSVKSRLRELLDYKEELERAAARPVRKPHRNTKAGA